MCAERAGDFLTGDSKHLLQECRSHLLVLVYVEVYTNTLLDRLASCLVHRQLLGMYVQAFICGRVTIQSLSILGSILLCSY